jgi:hypothetical protein
MQYQCPLVRKSAPKKLVCVLRVLTAAVLLSVGFSPSVIGNMCMSFLSMLHHRETLLKILSLHSNTGNTGRVKALNNKHILIYCI